MKSIIKNLSIGLALVSTVGFGTVSCINDLDDVVAGPGTIIELDDNAETVGQLMAKCYSGLAVSGQSGAGSSDMGGLDAGTSQYMRALFMMNEFTTDECQWIWMDEGVYDLNTNTFSSANANIFGTYSRLMLHISVCNDFLRYVNGRSFEANLQKEVDQFKLEARALRAFSYYHMIDLFGQVSWAWDDMAYAESPAQISRIEAYNRIVADLEEVRAAWPADLNGSKVVYGRIGIDAVDMLLAKFYLNAEVYTGTAAWDKCWDACQRIIARHEGTGGFNNSGLANVYQALFCANNDMFGPGGSLAGQNEILWIVPQQYELTESYGCSTFVIAAGTTKDDAASLLDCYNYGLSANWKCMHAREQFSAKFNFNDGVSSDLRTLMWGTENVGHTIENIDFMEFSNGYAPLKFTNVEANSDGSFPYTALPVKEGSKKTYNRFGDATLNATRFANPQGFADTDWPVYRLADTYLMAAECALHNAGNRTDGLKYLNYVRQRAGLSDVQSINENTLIDERARELYWENFRRPDLIRFGMYTGSTYMWSWKGGAAGGAATPKTMNLMPIPLNVISAQPSFKQNPGY